MAPLKLSDKLKEFIEKYPQVWETHEKVGSLIHEAGPLDKKNSHLIQLAIAASLQLHGAFCSHVSQAVDAGATPDEVYHVILLTNNTVGWPTMMIAYSWAKEILEKLENEREK